MPEKAKILFRYIPVIAILVLHFLLGFASMSRKTPTFDETVHLTAGYCFWEFNDYRMNPENGNFPQRWAAIPLLLDDKIIPPVFIENSSLESNQWYASYQFLYDSGNNPDKMFLKGRTMMLLLSIMLGICVFEISKRIFGYEGGLVSLFLYALSPTILANAQLITSDITSVFAFILSTWTLWRLLHKVNLFNLVASSLSVSLLCLSKMSAPIILPVFLILLVVRLKRKLPLAVKLGKWRITADSQQKQLFIFIACGIMNCVAAFFFIWASCGFRYDMIDVKHGKYQNVGENWKMLQTEPGLTENVINVFRKYRILPEAYLYGYQFVLKNSQFRYAYLNGKSHLTGWWYFFPYSCLVKTPIPTLLLLLILSVYAYLRLSGKLFGCLSDAQKEKLYLALPFGILCLTYLIFALTSNMNIGHRHVLLLYPCAFIFMGAAASLFHHAKKYLKAIMILILLWICYDSFSIYPHYLAYFNRIAGGPENGYKHLVDSSLDWGQDLVTLREWLATNNTNREEVYISYFGTASIDRYVKANKLPSYRGDEGGYAFRLGCGIYCISATMRTLIYMPEFFKSGDLSQGTLDENRYKELETELEPLFAAENNPESFQAMLKEKGREYWISRYKLFHLLRFVKLAKFIQPLKPDANAGYSILIYRLTDDDIAKALATPLNIH